MKTLSILLSLLLSINAHAITYSVNLGDGEPGAPAYDTAASFPAVAVDGALAVDKSTSEIYVYDAGTSSWILAGGGGGGTVTSVSGTAPIVSSGGATPAISIPQATAIADGFLDSADWSTFNGKEGAVTATTSADYYRGDKTFQTLNGLAVANTPAGNIAAATTQAAINELDSEKIASTEKGANNGVASLDAGGKIPATQLPNSVMELQGQWNASTNTPALADGTGNPGDVYEVTAAGTQDLGSGNITFAVGDFIIYGASGDWFKSINSNEVVSVNGQVGVVSLDSADITEDTNLYFTTNRARTAAVADAINNGTLDIAPSQNAVFDALALKADAATSWNTAGNTGTAGTGVVGTTDNQPFTVRANNQDVFTVLNTHRGISATPSILPADATGVNQFDYRTFVDPTASTTGASHTGIYNQLTWDNGNAGFNNVSGSLQASSSQFTNNGSGTINFAATNANSAGFNNNSVTSQFKGVTSENNISSGSTVSDYNGIVSGLNTTGGIVPGSNAITAGLNFTDATIGQTNGVNQNTTFSGTTTNSQGVTGVNSFIQSNNTTTTTNGVQGFSSGIDLNDDSVANGVVGLNSYFNIRDDADAGYLQGLNVGLNQEDNSVSSGSIGLNVNMQYADASTAGNVSNVSLYTRTLGTVSLDSLSIIAANPELEGNSTIDNVTGVAMTPQVRGNAAVDNFTGGQFSPQLSGSATATNMMGLDVSPQVSGSAVLTNALTAINVNPQSSVGLSGATALNINMSSVTLDPAAIAAGAQKKAIEINDGAINANYNYTVPAASGFFQQHYIGGQAVVANGAPVSAFGFGTNLAQTVQLSDDWTIDPSGLGYVDVGFVGSLQFDAGKTMARWTGALGGAGNPSGAGDLTDAIMFRAAGILPQGGALTVTNMYGFQVDPNLFCILGTNCWGIFENTAAAENHLSKLAIGTGTFKVTNSSTALEIGNSKAFLNGRGTTATKNALTAVAGMMFYDTTLDELQWYDGAGWVTASGASAGDVNGPASSVDGEVALFDSTTGKLLKRATGTGVAKLTSGVLSVSNVDLTSEVTGILPNANTSADSANTASAIVTRDASGNFSAGTITAALTGNASTATALAANPSDCGAGTKATGIDAEGDLTCSAVSLSADVSGTLPAANGGFGTEIQESVAGTINNSNTAMTISQTPVSNASVKLFKNGLLLKQGTDYTISGVNITMTVAPNFAESLEAVYRY